MDLNERLGAAFSGYRSREAKGVEKALARTAVLDSAIVPMHSLQEILRPLFGKGRPREPDIGDHPDFLHLKGTKSKEYAPISTLFMDIESSTRLGLLYAPEDVYDIKNAFICTAIEIVRAFDGHVHRIMGDAVMAYFGRVGSAPEQGVVDALNCSAALQYFTEYVVVPRLEQEGFTEGEFGIRVGVDFGAKDKVLWAAYGYPGIEEVTATSFHVDSAAKLQHAAGRNQVMLGQSLVEFMDYPKELVSTKTSTRGAERVEEPYLTPNHTDASGKPKNYRQHVLNWKKHLELTQLGQEHTSVRSRNPVRVAVSRSSGGVQTSYAPGSLVLAKGDGLTFSVSLPAMRSIDSVTFSVENHGAEAEKAGAEAGQTAFQNHSKSYSVGSTPTTIVHTESALYRGLHYMLVDVSADGRSVYSTTLGVFVR
jgi:class 3 adenylate cyclase